MNSSIPLFWNRRVIALVKILFKFIHQFRIIRTDFSKFLIYWNGIRAQQRVLFQTVNINKIRATTCTAISTASWLNCRQMIRFGAVWMASQLFETNTQDAMIFTVSNFMKSGPCSIYSCSTSLLVQSAVAWRFCITLSYHILLSSKKSSIAVCTIL